MKKLFAVPTLLLAATLAAPTTMYAQTALGALVGVVRDSTGAVIPNTPVQAINEGTKVVYTGTTNNSGEYRIGQLPNGFYDVETKAAGFTASRITGLAINANNVQTQDVTLAIGGNSSTVEVTSEASVSIDTTTAQIGTTFAVKETQDLPTAAIGLGVINLSLLAPGAVSSGGVGAGVGPSISGQRPRNNNFLLDGVDNNSKSVTGPLLYVANDAVGQFVLLQNIYSAQYGHSSGGQFNTLIKTGTNSVHGGVYEYFQNRNLNAVTSTQGIANTANGVSGHFNPRSDFNRYGGTLGGPIVKDRLFAFANYERQTLGQTAAAQSICVPTAAGYATLNGMTFASTTNLKVYEQYFPTGSTASTTGCSAPTIQVSGTNGVAQNVAVGSYSFAPPLFYNHDYLTTSADYTISQKDTVRVRYIYNRTDGTDTAASVPTFFVGQPARYHLAAINYSHIFTPNLTNDLRLGYTRFASQTVVGPQTFPGLNAFPSLYFGDLSGYGTSLGPDPNAPQETIQNLYDFVDNITYVKGNHTLNVGGEFRKFIEPEIFTQRIRGDYEYTNFSQYLNDLSPSHLGQRNATSSGQSPTFYGDQSSIYLYANDDWRVTPKLTVNLGVRWEFTTVPTEERLQNAESNASVAGVLVLNSPQPQYNNVVPRIGVVYAPNENTSIRAAFGINTDVLYDNQGLNAAPLALATTENVPSLTTQTPNFLANGGLPAQISNAIFTNPAQERTAISAYLPNQIVPYSEQWTLGIQRVFARAYTAEVRYVGTRGIHLDTQTQLNSQSAVTTANQLPVNTTGGSITPNGANTLATLTVPVGSYTYNNLSNVSTTVSCPYYRLLNFCNAGFTSTITGYFPYGASNYNGLQTQLTRRFQNGLQVNAAYTYSRAFDDSTADVNSTALNPRRAQDFRNLRAEYARSALDHPNRITLEAIYDVPFFKGSNWFLKNLVGNLELAPVYTFQTAQYVTAQSGVDSNLNGDSAADRTFVNTNGVANTSTGVVPVLSAACASGTAGGGVINGTLTPATSCAANTIGYTAGSLTTVAGTRIFTPSTNAYYVQGGLGTLPTASRDTLPVGRIDNVDITAVKRFTFHDRFGLEVQVQALNVLNHSQFLPGSLNTINSITSTGSGASNFVTVTSGASFANKAIDFGNNARTMQLVGKITF